MIFNVYSYKDGVKQKTYTSKRPRTVYMSKEDILMNQLSLKIVDDEGTLYLTNLSNDKLVKIYSKSATHIIQGLNKLKSKKIIKIKSIGDRKKFRRVINALQLKQCPYCLTGFKPKSNAQKYCSKNCSKKARQDKDAERKRKWRKVFNQPTIGTINMSPHPKDNFIDEFKCIHSKKLKINGKK